MNDAGGRVWLALVLAGAAGSVDVVVFLTLVPVFASFMSGNSVQTGMALGQADWAEVWSHLLPVPLFVFGVLLGTVVVEVAQRRSAHHALAWVLGVELALLTGALVGAYVAPPAATGATAEWPAWLLTAPAIIAMGLQNTVLRRLGTLTVRTTFVTGLLTTLAEETAKYVTWRMDRWAEARDRPSTGPRGLAALAAVWGSYVLGAVGGTLAASRWGVTALAVPLSLVAGALLVDLVLSDTALKARRDARSRRQGQPPL